ncbi:MAG: DUF305 domain-containing protein [Pseudonocardiaceae bacterium]|nr:DUF305 domain-containing protein [Pseudonocardiaceae bacterium]
MADDETTDRTGEEQGEPDESAGEAGRFEGSASAGWRRISIIAASAVALLLIGAAAGMLLTRSVVDKPVTPESGSVDVGFSQDMSVHHLQAVTMANIVRERSRDQTIRGIAFDIASTQLGQIGRMKGWLTLWGQPEQALSTEHMKWMSGSAGNEHGHGAMGGDSSSGSGSSGGSGSSMPGMASKQEMAKLRSLSGKQLDVFFLQLMLRHHQGGVPMAEYAKQHASVAAVRALARSMLASQGNEIDLMTTMLEQRDAKPLPAPN